MPHARDLTHEEQASLNRLKKLGEDVGAEIEKLRQDPEIDRHWLGVAKVQFQLGFMTAKRAIERPTGF